MTIALDTASAFVPPGDAVRPTAARAPQPPLMSALPKGANIDTFVGSASARRSPFQPTPLTDEDWAEHLPPGTAPKDVQKTVAARYRQAGEYVFSVEGLNAVMAKGRDTLAQVEELAKQPGYERLGEIKHELMFLRMLEELHNRYGDKAKLAAIPLMNKDGSPGAMKWHRNDAGGAVSDISFAFVSKQEYLLFLSAPCRSYAEGACVTEAQGFSGRYKKMDVFDFLLDGKVYRHKPGQDGWEAEKPGDVSFLEYGDAWDYSSGPAYIMEYGRGPQGLGAYWFGMFQSYLGKTNDGAGTQEQMADALSLRYGQSHEWWLGVVRKLF